MIVDSLKDAFDRNTKPDHMVAVGLKRATGKTDELSTNTLVSLKKILYLYSHLFSFKYINYGVLFTCDGDLLNSILLD